jgi:uncharacterized protein (TIGR03067 family)
MTITGKWKIAEAEYGGKPLPAETFKDLILDLDETSYQIIVQTVVDSGLIELINDSSPRALRITALYGHNKGKIFHCIYKFDGEDLIMCYNLGGESFPASFETFENTFLYMARYKPL